MLIYSVYILSYQSRKDNNYLFPQPDFSNKLITKQLV